MPTARELAARMRRLPTLPDVGLEVLDLLYDPDYEVGRVSGSIERDPVLTGRLLEMANSVLFGAARRTSSVHEAVIRLGSVQTKAAVFSVSIMSVVPKLPRPLDVRLFWAYGLGSAVCARHLAPDLGLAAGDEAYLGALVHRLGEAFLAVSFPERFAAAYAKRSAGVDLDVALEKEFGVLPSELCAHVLEGWSFPDRVVHAVRASGRPEQADDAPLLALCIWTAGGLAREFGLGLEPPRHAEHRWVAGLPPAMRRELHELGYAHLVRFLTTRPGFPEEARALGRSLAGYRRSQAGHRRA